MSSYFNEETSIDEIWLTLITVLRHLRLIKTHPLSHKPMSQNEVYNRLMKHKERMWLRTTTRL